jgi:hypothetical protein
MPVGAEQVFEKAHSITAHRLFLGPLRTEGFDLAQYRTYSVLRFRPLRGQVSPMCGAYPVKPPFTFGCDPPVVSEATWTCHDMYVFAVDNRDFNVAIKRHSVYRLPFH